MIPFEFEYYQPETVDEAIQTFISLDARGLQPRYFAGGTETISMARVSSISFGALIDIKHIPACSVFRQDEHSLLLGSALPLSGVIESNVFHLLTLSARRVADHTAQHRITLGGNAAGTIFYHEAILPLLVSECRATLTGPQGSREVPLPKLFQPRLMLQKGELLVHFMIPAEALRWSCVHVKHTEGEKIGYPLVTAAAIRKGSEIIMAFSGIQEYPVMARTGAAFSGSSNAAAGALMAHIPQPLLADSYSTSEYRAFLLKSVISNILDELGGAGA